MNEYALNVVSTTAKRNYVASSPKDSLHTLTGLAKQVKRFYMNTSRSTQSMAPNTASFVHHSAICLVLLACCVINAC